MARRYFHCQYCRTVCRSEDAYIEHLGECELAENDAAERGELKAPAVRANPYREGTPDFESFEDQELEGWK